MLELDITSEHAAAQIKKAEWFHKKVEANHFPEMYWSLPETWK